MRYIEVPKPTVLENLLTEEPGDTIEFTKWVTVRLLVDPKWGKTGEGAVMAADIRRRLRDPVGGVVELDETSWKKLKEIADEPSVPYEMASMLQIDHFLLAITEASRKDPRRVDIPVDTQEDAA